MVYTFVMVYTVYMVCNIYTIHAVDTVDTVYTVYTIQTAFHCRGFNQTSYLSLISLILLIEKKLSCGEISAFHKWQLKISPHAEKFQTSPHERCGEIWNSPHIACVWCRKRRHICKIYAIFMWRKIQPKSTFVEKKWQIWGLWSRDLVLFHRPT